MHSKEVVSLLAQTDPVANMIRTNQISGINHRIIIDLVHSLNDLVATTDIGSSSIKSKVNNIGDLLDEAVSVCISKDVLNNQRLRL